jgi:hypothetical protein
MRSCALDNTKASFIGLKVDFSDLAFILTPCLPFEP